VPGRRIIDDLLVLPKSPQARVTIGRASPVHGDFASYGIVRSLMRLDRSTKTTPNDPPDHAGDLHRTTTCAPGRFDASPDCFPSLIANSAPPNH